MKNILPLGSLSTTFKASTPKRMRSPLCLSALGMGLVIAPLAQALPQNASVQSGDIRISQPQPNRLLIRQRTEQGVINWEEFSIGRNQKVRFQQPSVDSVTLNRVTGKFSSDISGVLKSNGTVLLLNPNGILFSPTAKVDVGGILATTLDISNQDFLSGNYLFKQSPDHPLSTVENQGLITVREGGIAALFAPGVSNRGVIQARLGQVALGSGTSVVLDFYQDGLLSFEVDASMYDQILGADGQPLSTLLNQSGTIRADGGSVFLSARTGSDVLGNVLNLSGITQAQTVQNREGKILLTASPDVQVQVAGQLDVSGLDGAEVGGTISLEAGEFILSGADLNASAQGQGGTINLRGSSPQGGISVDANSLLDASSANSDAGQVVLISEGLTAVDGTLRARATGVQGDGGFIETSGSAGLSVTSNATVDASSLNGAQGRWLLDPDRLFITQDGGGFPIGDGTEESVSTTAIVAALELNDVELVANELIEVNAPIEVDELPFSDTSEQLTTTLAFNDENTSPLTVNLNAPIRLLESQTLTGEATEVNINVNADGIVQNAVDIAAPDALVQFDVVADGGTPSRFTNEDANPALPVVVIDKDLTLVGQGSEQTILDGGSDGDSASRRVVQLESGVNVQLEDLAIENGVALGSLFDGVGGGLLVPRGSSATLDNVRVENNTAFLGGGIFSQGQLTITDSEIIGNLAQLVDEEAEVSLLPGAFDGVGGGLYSDFGSELDILLSDITANNAEQAGGGLANLGLASIDQSTLAGNQAGEINQFGIGGGLINVAVLNLKNSTFVQNSAAFSGGGIANGVPEVEFDLDDIPLPPEVIGQLNLTNVTISNNVSGFGGGLSTSLGTVQITHGTLTQNTALQQGGGIFQGTSGNPLLGSDLSIANSIVAGNTTENPIFMGNTVLSAPEVSVAEGANFTSQGNNLVGQNGNEGGFTRVSTDILATGSIETVLAPLANNGGSTQTHALVAGSEAIDAANSALAVDASNEPLLIDQRGGERSPTGLNSGSASDIGAFEATSSVVVTQTQDSLEIGTLRAAVDFANQSQNANPENLASPQPNTIRFDAQNVFADPQTISLSEGALVFDGANVPIFLEGLGPDRLSVTSDPTTPSRLFNVNAGDVTIEGVTFEGGDSFSGGAGLVAFSGTLNLEDTLFQNNVATSSGGAIVNQGVLNISNSAFLGNESGDVGGAIVNQAGTVTVSDSDFENNVATSSGGALANQGLLDISDSNLVGNESGGFGGAIVNQSGTLTISNSSLTQNTSALAGGAIASIIAETEDFTTGSVSIAETTVAQNTANTDGGGLYSEGNTISVVSSTFSENTALINGGGIVIAEGLLDGSLSFSDGLFTLDSMTASGNTASGGDGIFDGGTSDGLVDGGVSYSEELVTLENVTISGNTATSGGGLFVSGQATATHVTIAENVAQQGGGIFQTGSLTLNSSIVSGNDASLNPEYSASGEVPPSLTSDGLNRVGQNGDRGGFPDSETVFETSFSQNLSPLNNHGGNTETHALLPGSAAIDGALNNLLEVDQRGIARSPGTSDVGAFESQGFNVAILQGAEQSTSVDTDFPEPTVFQVTSDFEEPVLGGNLIIESQASVGANVVNPNQLLEIGEDGTASTQFTANSEAGSFELSAGQGTDAVTFQLTNESEAESPDIDSPAEKIDQELKESLESVKGTSNELLPPPDSTPAIALTPGLGEQITQVESIFTEQMARYLGIESPENIDQLAVQDQLRQVADATSIKPALIYAFFTSARENRNEALSRTSTLLASADPQGLIAQADASTSEDCLSEKVSRDDDPLWQFDQCGWNNVSPTPLRARNDDQLVLLLVNPEGKAIRQVVPDTRRDEIVKKVKAFQRTVTDVSLPATQSLGLAQQLHQWLIDPVTNDLEAEEIESLVFVMDEGLRSLPLAALHNGTNYLIEDYTVGLMPSMSLADTEFVSVRDMEVLAMGANQFQSLSPLPSVPVEISTIAQEIWQGETHLNETFTPETLVNAREANDYGIVHLATHGEFRKGNRDRSYIQFWDQKVRLGDLDSLNLTGSNPVSLLVLSACNTALGDPKAELGFTGLAVASGVQTAMGGLWYINDVATLGLMTSFYQNLRTAPIKAEALRAAQLSMLRGETKIMDNQVISGDRSVPLPAELLQVGNLDLSHPYYWSGITMIGTPW